MFCFHRTCFQRKASAVAGALAAAFCVGCDGAPSPSQSSGSAPVAQVEGFEQGKISITGRVVLNGKPASPDTIVNVGGDAFCKGHGEISTERWKVSSGGGLADVVVAVMDAPGTPTDSRKALISQQGCVYRPHLSAISAGQSVTIQNSDSTFHNVRVVEHQLATLNRGRNIENYGQPTKGSSHVHRFVKPGIYRLECDVHRWMRSWVYVHFNNHVAVTGEDGTFSIDYGLKDGSYQIAAWHSQFANSVTAKVEIVDGLANVELAFSASEALN